MNIILLAPPAAGKGTIASSLKEKYSLNHISTGDLLRQEIGSGSKLGIEIDSLIRSGSLIPDNIMTNMLENELKKEHNSNGYILDGYPRTIKQAELYDQLLVKFGYHLGCVIYLDIDKETAIKRSINRLICLNCGMVYNKQDAQYMPKVSNICNHCHQPLVTRSDDNYETINRRFEIYQQNIKPLLDYYQAEHVLFRVNSNRSRKDILTDIEAILKRVDMND